MTRHFNSVLIAAALLAIFSGCDLDVTNPNAASEEQVLTTPEGLQAVAVGMQEFYATMTYESNIIVPGVTSRELAVNTTLANFIELEQGGAAMPSTNSDILRVFSRNLRVVGMADDLTTSIAEVPLDPGTESGILALANLFKAMALGGLAQAFEQAPVETDREGRATFVSREAALDLAIDLLDEAVQQLNAVPPSAAFESTILANGIDLVNTIHAYRARFNLFAANYQNAIDAADEVDPAATSVFMYDDQSPNPIHLQMIQLEYFAPRDEFGIETVEPNDRRLDFYMDEADALSNPGGYPIEDVDGFFTTRAMPIPLYLPGEMPLIRAEALVRLDQLDQAVDEIDAVRTKTPAEDPFGVGADLPAYSGPVTAEALLDEIFYQRRAELFMQGLGLEDHRRFDRELDPADPFGRSRNWYPYPEQERQNNPNTPPNPSI